MTTNQSPIHIGKAILAENRLTVQGAPYKLHTHTDFAKFVVATSAIVCTALATMFKAGTGLLVFKNGVYGTLQAESAEPWQQYNGAAHAVAAKHEEAKVIIGWCALLSLYNKLLPNPHVEIEAVAIAHYIASEGFKAAYATEECVDKWLKYEAYISTHAGFIASMEGLVDKPDNPWDKAQDLSLPAIPALGNFTALDIICLTLGDIIVTNGSALASAGVRHFIQCADAFDHIERKQGPFMVKIEHAGKQRSFRAQVNALVNGEEMVLRPLPGLPPTLGE